MRDTGNPDMPGSIYGIKFDAVPDDQEDSGTYVYFFKTAREPVWGSLYAKDGQQGGTFTTAWNTAFGTQPDLDTMDFSGWIARPDGSTSNVPVPSTVLLLGCGLLGLALLKARAARPVRLKARSPIPPDHHLARPGKTALGSPGTASRSRRSIAS